MQRIDEEGFSYEDLVDCIEDLESAAAFTSREFRSAEVERITERYLAENGKPPATHLLDRLTNVFLHEELSDPHPDKMSRKITPEMTEDERRRHEYPIMSDAMHAARTKGSGRKRRKDGSLNIEVSFIRAADIGMDGKNYAIPQRNFTNKD